MDCANWYANTQNLLLSQGFCMYLAQLAQSTGIRHEVWFEVSDISSSIRSFLVLIPSLETKLRHISSRNEVFDLKISISKRSFHFFDQIEWKISPSRSTQTDYSLITARLRAEDSPALKDRKSEWKLLDWDPSWTRLFAPRSVVERRNSTKLS